jgi:hypothetical protein
MPPLKHTHKPRENEEKSLATTITSLEMIECHKKIKSTVTESEPRIL